MKVKSLILIATLLVTLLPCALWTRAQGKRSSAPRKAQQTRGDSQRAREAARDEIKTARNELLRAAKDYKTSLGQLLALYEKSVREAALQHDKLKTLYSEGLISRRQMEEGEAVVAAAQRKVDDVKKQIASADKMVAEALIEVEIAPPLASGPLASPGKLTNTVAYIRYTGSGTWSLGEAWKIQSFFKEKFGHPLPVSTFGQSQLHDRWGLDHRNAMDVGVNPDSREGQALMAFLRANGIPFTAFRVAIQGSSTGPHIHIGSPSRRSFSFVTPR